MTISEALALAQSEHPLDLAARLEYMHGEADQANSHDRVTWEDAITITRNGSTRRI